MNKKGDLSRGRFMLSKASIFKRFAALLIDLLILDFFVIFPFQNIIREMAGNNFSEVFSQLQNNPELISQLTSVFVAISFVSLLYLAILQYKFGQTIGMMIMKLYIINVDEKTKSRKSLDGFPDSPIGFWKSIARNLFIVVVFPFYILWAAEPLFMLFNKENQRLLEILTKTKTVQVFNLDNFSG